MSHHYSIWKAMMLYNIIVINNNWKCFIKCRQIICEQIHKIVKSNISNWYLVVLKDIPLGLLNKYKLNNKKLPV